MADAVTVEWDRKRLLDSPCFATLHLWIARLPGERFPTHEDLNALAEDSRLHNAAGKPIRFQPPQGERLSAREYESSAYASGVVSTRADNLHDLFNALAWLAFPNTKAWLNRRHVEDLQQAPPGLRSALRDRLTLFDESGMLVLSDDPALGELLAAFDWKALFVAQRSAVEQRMSFQVVGHALHEKLVTPFRGITAHALVVAMPADWATLPEARRSSEVDRLAMTALEQSMRTSARHRFQPIPVLGIPGWDSNNRDARYYDDVGYFRPGRREK